MTGRGGGGGLPQAGGVGGGGRCSAFFSFFTFTFYPLIPSSAWIRIHYVEKDRKNATKIRSNCIFFWKKLSKLGVLRIRIRINTELLPGSGSGIVVPDPVKEKYEDNFLRFLFQNSKMPFLGVNQFFLKFFSVLSLKTIDTQRLFWSVFLKTH